MVTVFPMVSTNYYARAENKCDMLFWLCLILAHLVVHKMSAWLIYLPKHQTRLFKVVPSIIVIHIMSCCTSWRTGETASLSLSILSRLLSRHQQHPFTAHSCQVEGSVTRQATREETRPQPCIRRRTTYSAHYIS